MDRPPQVHTKLQEEDYTLAVDFAGDLQTGETITGAKVFARRPYYGPDVTAELFPDPPTVSGSIVSVRITGGKARDRYAVHIIAVTNVSPGIGTPIDLRIE